MYAERARFGALGSFLPFDFGAFSAFSAAFLCAEDGHQQLAAHIRTPPGTPRRGGTGSGEWGGSMLTLVALVDSFGICWSAYIVSSMFDTSRDFVEARRHAQHDRDAYSWARVWARRAAPVDDDDGHVSIAREHQIRGKSGHLHTLDLLRRRGECVVGGYAGAGGGRYWAALGAERKMAGWLAGWLVRGLVGAHRCENHC